MENRWKPALLARLSPVLFRNYPVPLEPVRSWQPDDLRLAAFMILLSGLGFYLLRQFRVREVGT